MDSNGSLGVQWDPVFAQRCTQAQVLQGQICVRRHPIQPHHVSNSHGLGMDGCVCEFCKHCSWQSFPFSSL